jgi:hypothetical protein
MGNASQVKRNRSKGGRRLAIWLAVCLLLPVGAAVAQSESRAPCSGLAERYALPSFAAADSATWFSVVGEVIRRLVSQMDRREFAPEEDSASWQGVRLTRDSLARLVHSDTTARRQAAAVLATVIARWRGEKTRLGAVLYDDWRLPLQPARSVLRDRDQSSFARMWAASALHAYDTTSWLRTDALLVLCDLGGRAAGQSRVWGEARAEPTASIHRFDGILDHEERGLLGYILMVFTTPPADSSLPGRVDRLLGTDNPVSRYVADYWRQRIRR